MSGAEHEVSSHAVPADYWEERYAGVERVWSGAVNRVVAEVSADLAPGTALDLGCGEGADVIHLASIGWHAIGMDISPTAVQRATRAAEAAGLSTDKARFVTGDLATLPDGPFDLVTASFLHSPVALDRSDILRRAAAVVRAGGHLLVTSHASAPPWAPEGHRHTEHFPSPEDQEVEADVRSPEWDVVISEVRSRSALGPDGKRAELDDVVLLARRRG